MHLLEKPVDYSKTEEFNKEVNKLTLEDAKRLVKKLYEDNRNYKQLAARAAITVEQYKHLLSVFDGYSEDKENISAVANQFGRILLGVIESTKDLSLWVHLLAEAAKRIVFEDSTVKEMFSLVGNVCYEIYSTSCQFKARQVLLPDEPKGVCVRNLERTEEENIEIPPKGFYSLQSAMINRQEENTNILQKKDKDNHQQHEKSTVDDEVSSVQDDGRSGEESDNSSLKQSESNDYNEGGENRCEEETHENVEKRKEKTFGITYPKSQNLFEHDVIQSKTICSNVSAECDESEHSATFDQLTKSDNDINEDYESLSENDMTKDVDTFSGHVSSKSSSKYKRKNYLSRQEGNVTKRGRKKRKINTSQNSGTVAKRPRRFRRSHDSNTFENYDDVKGVDKSETVILQDSTSSTKRYVKSSKHETSNIHKTASGENSFRKKSQKVKNQDSGNEMGAGDSSVKPKRNRRGRRKKSTVEQETNKNLKSSNKGESVYFENVPHGSKDVVKRAYVHLTDVLDDPEAQHYTDIIQYKEKKENESASGVRWKEKTETEERNEMDALQEWNVLDAVSDEEDKEFVNTEGVEGMPTNDNQVFDSDVEQEETVNDDDKEQLEIDDSDKELEDSSDVEHEENCLGKHEVNRSCNISDSESKGCKKGPSTPDVSPHESKFEDNSDVQDENDGDADSVRSNEEDISSSRPAPGSLIYGSKEASSPHSDEGEVLAVMDDEESDSECSSD